MAFDPDAYLAAKKSSFDPDAYLASKRISAGISADSQKQPSSSKVMDVSHNPLLKLAPSNAMKLMGVATANAPGAASLILNSLPMGNLPSTVPSAIHLARNPGQVKEALKRVALVDAGAPLKPEEAMPAKVGGYFGTALETAAMPGAGATNEVPEMALTPARRALGFQKPFLKTPFARGQAQLAAKTALENDVIPLSGDPTTMMNRAAAIKANVGREIGQTLEKTPAGVKTVLDDLSALKTRLSQGADEGILAKANPLIDDVSKSIESLSSKGKTMTAKTITDIKTKVSGMVNYFSDLATQTDNKAIANQLGNSVRNMVKTFNSPEVYSKFIGNQKLYNAYSTMVKGLNNEIAAQMSNMPLSLPSAVVGATEMATNPIKGLATMGLFEGAKRRGTGITARALVELARSRGALPKLSPIANAVFRKKDQE